MSTTTPMPPIPDVPYMIGIAADLGALHAVCQHTARWAAANGDSGSDRVSVGAECGTVVVLARQWGAFRRGNQRLGVGRACLRCAWTVALDQDAVDAELAVLVPTEAQRPALDRALPDPLLVHRICTNILAARDAAEDYDTDHPRWAEHLAHIAAHNPILLVDEACADNECEHDGEADCYQDSPVACPTCSIRAGSWAGEWAGQVDMLVPAPCSVVLTAETTYRGPATTGTGIAVPHAAGQVQR